MDTRDSDLGDDSMVSLVLIECFAGAAKRREYYLRFFWNIMRNGSKNICSKIRLNIWDDVKLILFWNQSENVPQATKIELYSNF